MIAIAQIHTWRGERDAAFQYLDRAVRERNSSVLDTIRVDPILDGLDGDYGIKRSFTDYGSASVFSWYPVE